NLIDSEAIFKTMLIDAAIQDAPHMAHPRDQFSIIELKEEHFNKYLDILHGSHTTDDPAIPSAIHVHSLRRSSNQSATPMLTGTPLSPQTLAAHVRPPQMSSRSQGSRLSRASQATSRITQGGGGRRLALQRSYSMDFTQWVSDKWNTFKDVWREIRAALFRNGLARGVKGDDGDGRGTVNKAYALMDQFNVDDETFFQERYISGGLFPAYVADELLIQSFYNASINVFMRHVLDGKSIFMLYDIPVQWRHLQLSYGDLVSRMTRQHAHALPIGLLRAPSFLNGAAKPYVYTSPYAHTIVDPHDKVFVLINHSAIHRVARKLQRRFAARKRWRQTVAAAVAAAPQGQAAP
ncbi:hypothetical protein DYB34_010560, partial [Aphanomyces astaci]